MADISNAARDVLAGARVEENILYLPPAPRLERKLYEEVNEVLTRLGGKWKSGKVQGHVFDSDPSSDLQVLVQTGIMPPKNPTAFFATPQSVIQQMLYTTAFDDLPVRPSLRFLEPSAGKGAIALALRAYVQKHYTDPHSITIHCCEIVPTFAAYLHSQGFEVVADDFLRYHPQERYDAIVMNPPFSVEGDKQAYITHIRHAWDMLTEGGVLVAIAPAGFTFRSDKKVREFSTLVEMNGKWDKLPSESFKESGTGIETVILSMTKPTPVEMAHRIVDKAEQFRKVAEEMEVQIVAMERKIGVRESQEEEAVLRAANIPYTPPKGLEHAYELTQAIEKAATKSKDAPVFGDPLWISRAKQRRAS